MLSCPIRAMRSRVLTPGGGREGVPGVPQVVELQPRRTDGLDRLHPPHAGLKLLRLIGTPLAPVNTSAVGSGETNSARWSVSSVTTPPGRETVRSPALDFGGPTTRP